MTLHRADYTSCLWLSPGHGLAQQVPFLLKSEVRSSIRQCSQAALHWKLLTDSVMWCDLIWFGLANWFTCIFPSLLTGYVDVDDDGNVICMVMLLCGSEVKFQCMGTWYDDDGNIYSAMADIGRDQFRERFRCMVCMTLWYRGHVLPKQWSFSCFMVFASDM